MPMYEWECPQCKGVTNIVNSVANYNNPPEVCDPSPVQTEEKKPNGEPVYQKIPSCGYNKPEGWRKLVGSTKFILKGIGWFRDGYS